MTYRKLTLALLTAALLAGCKIVIQVPAGGQVVTQSGGYKACAAGKTCTIDVSDLFFNEVFIARPAAGYTFKHWKKKDRAFCGGKKGSCALQSAPLGTDPGLMALLESNERFFLQPVFVKKSDDGALGKQNAAVCFNPVDVGTKIVTNYSTRDKISGEVTRSRLVTEFTGFVMYKASRSLRSKTVITLPGDASFRTVSISYAIPDNARTRFTSQGGEAETFLNGALANSTLLEFMPGQLTRFDLAPGQSYTQNYTANTMGTFNGMTISDSQAIKRTTTYIGVDKITVPAGTRDACKFREVTTTTFQGFSSKDTRNLWYDVGSGIQVQEDNDSSITKLVSGSIDGKSI